MKKVQIFILVIALVAGALLLGSGISGLVISQSCCFPPNCPLEYLCDAAEPHLERPASVSHATLGGLIVSVALVMLFLVGKKHNP